MNTSCKTENINEWEGAGVKWNISRIENLGIVKIEVI